MWLFTPDAFYSVRPYDPEKGGVEVDEPHVQVRARVEADIEKVRRNTMGWFDTNDGHDYTYQLALPVREWARYLGRLAEQILTAGPMKSHTDPRSDVHMSVWNATWGFQKLDRS